MVQRFLVWSADLPKLENIKIPRSYFKGPFDNVELHMFGDSSQDIFSAVAFLRARVTTPTGKVKTELVLGKARVAPMKVMTVPKLELQAALLAARLKREIMQAITVSVNQVFMWTDSTTVIQWINSNEKQPIFVANRVCEILEYTSVDQWNHDATKDNPADAGTRGMSAEVLQLSSWVNGPHLLINSSFPFVPNEGFINNMKLGVNQAVIIEDTVSLATSVKKQITPVPSLFPFDKFSSYQKYLRIATYVFQLLPKHAGYRNPMVALLTLLSLTKPSVIYSTWCKEILLKPKEKIFLTINSLNGVAELLHIHRLLVEMGNYVPRAASSA